MLEPIGLSRQDETVYEVLVRRVHATVAELALDSQLPVPATRRSVRSLVSLGLAVRSTGRPVTYAAVSPDSALEAVLRERERALHDVRSHISGLMDLYRAATRFVNPGELVEVVSGRDDVNRRWAQLQQSTRTQVRGFDRPPYATVEEHTQPNPVELELLKRGVAYRVIYDSTVLTLPGWLANVTIGIQHGEQARVASDLPMKLAVFDDRIAIIPLLRPGDNTLTASYVIHPSPLLDALVALFETLWERSMQVRLPAHGGSLGSLEQTGDELSAEEAKLLTLLAAGATDKSAGRALGWSERTVQRHVTRLMQRFGAQTRFQIAMEATRRGWI
ncbi:helix-turn-helix transcriptional regulator [Actinacidiphila sp. bgisy167]|uniref:helix-turn-helix transcriptional regulator n=1 Tax=Actinacidiphila sp. bgisy167 TaxID=3413797 RepID=UPI003D758A9B